MDKSKKIVRNNFRTLTKLFCFPSEYGFKTSNYGRPRPDFSSKSDNGKRVIMPTLGSGRSP